MYIDFIKDVHTNTKRDYMKRNENKAEKAIIAKRFDYEFFDGDREHGYGGLKYDGRWAKVAEKFIEHYNIKPGDRILDVGCAKGFMLYEIQKLVPDVEIYGFDISEYAIENAKEEVKHLLYVGDASDSLPFDDNFFDFVFSINTLHNLYIYDFIKAVSEIERVSKQAYIVVESYRNEYEKTNLFNWILTAQILTSPKEWEWMFEEAGYSKDYSFIFFE